MDKRTRHGMSRRGQQHPLIKIWQGMIQRCERPHASGYEYYGGQGITVCERWHDPRLFAEDLEREIGPRPEGMTLDRIDPYGNYEPGNVRWATRSQQMRNRRPFKRPGPTSLWENRAFRTEVCDYCGNQYDTRALAEDVRFCSKACRAAHRRASGADNVERTCHQCGDTFTSNRYDGTRHCSKSCGVTCWRAGDCPG